MYHVCEALKGSHASREEDGGYRDRWREIGMEKDGEVSRVV